VVAKTRGNSIRAVFGFLEVQWRFISRCDGSSSSMVAHWKVLWLIKGTVSRDF